MCTGKLVSAGSGKKQNARPGTASPPPSSALPPPLPLLLLLLLSVWVCFVMSAATAPHAMRGTWNCLLRSLAIASSCGGPLRWLTRNSCCLSMPAAASLQCRTGVLLNLHVTWRQEICLQLKPYGAREGMAAVTKILINRYSSWNVRFLARPEAAQVQPSV
jgi:hypothetical protein